MKNGLALLFLFSLMAAYAMPSLGVNFRSSSSRRASDKNTMNAVLDILRENRTGLASAEEFKLAQVITGESEAHRIDPLFILALIKTESTFYNWSRSLNGALGLMQILPSTGRGIASELNLKWAGNETLLDPFMNVKMGIHYFSTLKDRFNDDTARTLAAYNIGPTYLSSNMDAGMDVTGGFVKKVLENYRDMKERVEYN
ncbi:MAG: lytic transglycosylase domain-containing protein [Deltaproteobacteria bacterium]|nr:lytic transglycosylase domain-containing protein [Deltaproteobacteria bacterium]